MGKKYIIKDIWLLFSVFFRAVVYGVLIYFISLLSIIVIFSLNKIAYDGFIVYYQYIYGVLFLFYLLSVFLNYYSGYTIDLKNMTFSFPANDVENSIIDILTLKRIRDYARRKTVAIEEINDIYIDSKKVKDFSIFTNKKTKTVYRINIAGIYGSDNLEFSSRQKRDELRSKLVYASKVLKHKISDRKIAEFI